MNEWLSNIFIVIWRDISIHVHTRFVWYPSPTLHLSQVGGFLRVLRFHQPIKLTLRYNWKIIESGNKHHSPNNIHIWVQLICKLGTSLTHYQVSVTLSFMNFVWWQMKKSDTNAIPYGLLIFIKLWLRYRIKVVMMYRQLKPPENTWKGQTLHLNTFD